MKLRLLLFSECDRHCAGCCNEQHDLGALPICRDFRGYDEVILTGGEPMLDPGAVRRAVELVRRQHDGPIYLYTAKLDDIEVALDVLALVDGFTVTLHEQSDAETWFNLDTNLPWHWYAQKSLRLNVLEGVNVAGYDTTGWKVKGNIKWITSCPMPEGEVFMRLGDPE